MSNFVPFDTIPTVFFLFIIVFLPNLKIFLIYIMIPLPKANRKYANEKDDSDDSNAKESSSNKSGKGSGGKSKAAKKETDNKKNAPLTANSRKDFHEAFKSVFKQIIRVGDDTLRYRYMKGLYL